MKLSFQFLLLLAILLTNCNKINNTSKSDVSENKKNQILIDSLLKDAHNRGVFNGNILVAKNNKIIYQNEFGFSDGTKSKKLNRNSIFNIGSIAKEFNAVAIMILNERGLLNLDDKISKFNLQLPKWSNTVSVKQLLQYTSGLPKVNWRNIKNDQDIYNDLKNIKHLKFKPGSSYLYSNNNVFLQRRIVEKISDMSFNDFIRENILIPGNMNNAVLDANSHTTKLVVAFNNNFVNDKPMNIEFSGWVYPTVNDMYNWLTNLHSGKFITNKSLITLFGSHFKNSSSALGNGVFKNDNLLIHEHHGSSFNYESFTYYNVKENLAIILMTNNKNRKLRKITKSIENILKNSAS